MLIAVSDFASLRRIGPALAQNLHTRTGKLTSAQSSLSSSYFTQDSASSFLLADVLKEQTSGSQNRKQIRLILASVDRFLAGATKPMRLATT